MRRRGEISVWTLAEVMIGLFALVTVAMIVNGMIDNSSFYQSFYAKDNAHIVEALHAVPNGEVHIAYLWSTKEYSINLAQAKPGEIANAEAASRVTVRKVEKAIKDQVEGKHERTKYFGSNAATPVTTTGFFEPQFYQYIGKRSSIVMQRSFHELKCISATGTIGTVSVQPKVWGSVRGNEGWQPIDTASAQFSAPERAAAAQYAASLEQQFVLQQQSNEGEPLVLTIALRHSTIERIGVYYNDLSNRAQRATCLIAQELSEQQNVEYGPAPRTIQQGDVVVLIETDDINTFRDIATVIGTSLQKYEETQ